MSGKVLITGGHGNLGSYITKYLVENGYEVSVLTKKSTNKIKGLEYSIIEADITKIEILKKKLDFKVDYCIHLASFNEFFSDDYSSRALEINTLGTRNLLEIFGLRNLKNFIYFSTFHVYGASSGVISELKELNPKNDYASTHLFAEYYVKQFGFTHKLNYTILRLTNSYGVPLFKETNKWYLVLNDLVKSAYKNHQIVLNSNGKSRRDFIHMNDVSIIVEKLLKQKALNEVFNLSSGKTYKVIDLAQKVKHIYIERYNKDINILLNEDDLTLYKELVVKNDKLNERIDFIIHDKIDEEINNIFELLESKCDFQ